MFWQSLILGVLLYLTISVHCFTKRAWNYEILSINATSSNDNLLTVSSQLDRLSFSESAISGTFVTKFDTDANTTFVFHSVSGRDEDYYELPYKIPITTLEPFIDNYYKNLVYPNIRDCSDFPEIKGKFVAPWPKGTYKFQSCRLTGDGFPYILPSGYYKIWVRMRTVVEVNVVGIAKITSKLI